MPDMDDFYAFQSTGGGGVPGGCLTRILLGLVILWVFIKLVGCMV